MGGSCTSEIEAVPEDAAGAGTTFFVLIAVLTMFTVTSVRLVAPFVYHAASTFDAAGVLTVAAAGTAAALAAWRGSAASPTASLVAFAGTAAALRIVIQLTGPGSGSSVVFALLCAFALGFALTEAVPRVGAPITAAGVVAGMGVDVTVRAAFLTTDPAWLGRGAAPLGLAAAQTAILAATASRLHLGARTENRPPASVLGGAGVGAAFVLHVLLFQNVALVSSGAPLSLVTALPVVLAGDVLALVWFATRGTQRTPPAVVVLAAATLTVVVWAMAGPRHAVHPALVGIGSVLTSVLMVEGLEGERRSSRRSHLAASGGLIAALPMVLLQQVHYKRPLPVDDEVVMLAVVVALVTAALARRQRPRRRTRPRSLVVSAAALATTGIAVTIGLSATDSSRPSVGLAGPAIRVVGYNVDNAISRSGHLDPGELATTIEALAPDVVLLQEVPRGLGWSASLDLALWLSRRLDMAFAFGPAADDTLGNLILSKGALRDVRSELLPRLGRQARRSAVLATVDVGGRMVTLVNLHVQHGRGAAPTAARLQQLATALERWGGRPRTVLVGDVNAGPGSAEVGTILAAGFTTTADTTSCTKPTGHQECLDWIFVTQDLSQGDTEVPARGPSDHNPVLSVVTIDAR